MKRKEFWNEVHQDPGPASLPFFGECLGAGTEKAVFEVPLTNFASSYVDIAKKLFTGNQEMTLSGSMYVDMYPKPATLFNKKCTIKMNIRVPNGLVWLMEKVFDEDFDHRDFTIRPLSLKVHTSNNIYIFNNCRTCLYRTIYPSALLNGSYVLMIVALKINNIKDIKKESLTANTDLID